MAGSVQRLDFVARHGGEGRQALGRAFARGLPRRQLGLQLVDSLLPPLDLGRQLGWVV